MGELKPIGSEKLQGNAKLKRILELTYYNDSNDLKKSTETIVESVTGVYGIVKEKDGFYVKKGLTESSLDYIGGLFMKNKNRFHSHAEAFKKLQFLVEQEKVQEATKYVLKTPKPQQEAPMPEPVDDVPPPSPAAPEGEASAPAPGEESPIPPEGESSPETEENYLEIVQSAAGKLQQKLRKYEDRLKSEDIKGALMQVLSAIDVDKQLEEEDKDEILSKFEPEEEEEMSPEGSEVPTPPAEDELGEDEFLEKEPEEVTDGMAALEELITHPFEDDYIGGDDDDDDFEPLDFEDRSAQRAAESDIETEYSDEDDIEGTTDEFLPDEDEEETDEQSIPSSSTPMPEPESLPSEPTEPNNLDVTELDINELTDALNTSVKETLSKYFE